VRYFLSLAIYDFRLRIVPLTARRSVKLPDAGKRLAPDVAADAPPPPAKKSKTTVAVPAPSPADAALAAGTGSGGVAPGQRWRGECVYRNSQERYPVELRVEWAGAGDALEGTATWSSLPGCPKTRWRGRAQADRVEIEEYEALPGPGQDEVELPARWTLRLQQPGARVLEGQLASPPPGEEVSLRLEHVGGFEPGTTFRGQARSPLAYTLRVERRAGPAIHGVIAYPSLGLETEFEGTVPDILLSLPPPPHLFTNCPQVDAANGKLQLRETKVRKGPAGLVPLPQVHEVEAGTWQGTSTFLEGSITPPAGSGTPAATFTLRRLG
jgi:hypothetical protein